MKLVFGIRGAITSSPSGRYLRFAQWADVKNKTSRIFGRVEDRFTPILVAFCANQMRGFAVLHRFFQGVGNSPAFHCGVSL
jgi:hypothetical protein